MSRISAYVESEGLEVGARLPSERELRSQLNVGRSTVREALKSLEAIGLVRIRQGSGVFVADRPQPTPEPSAPDWSQLGAIIEARLAIEPYAAALAAQRRTPEQLARIEAEVDRFDAAVANDDRRDLVMADVHFHEAIAETGNPVLGHSLRELRVLIIRSRYLSLRSLDRQPRVATAHREIFDAITDYDGEVAYERMAAHLVGFVHLLGFQTLSSGRGTHLLEVGIPTSLRRAIENMTEAEDPLHWVEEDLGRSETAAG
jgi:GntR family transcriptional repressor for pyruvate dehydrogenase complex